MHQEKQCKRKLRARDCYNLVEFRIHDKIILCDALKPNIKKPSDILKQPVKLLHVQLLEQLQAVLFLKQGTSLKSLKLMDDTTALFLWEGYLMTRQFQNVETSTMPSYHYQSQN